MNWLGSHKFPSQGQPTMVDWPTHLDYFCSNPVWCTKGRCPPLHSGRYRCVVKLDRERGCSPGQFQQLDKPWGSQRFLFRLLARLAVLRVDSVPVLHGRNLLELEIKRDYCSREGLGTKLFYTYVTLVVGLLLKTLITNNIVEVITGYKTNKISCNPLHWSVADTEWHE